MEEAKMCDVVIHMNEDLDHSRREGIKDLLSKKDGIIVAMISDSKPHLMVVEYDPDTVKTLDILHELSSEGIHAQQLG